ncbi:MAG TPA: thiamine-phosphate kinase, partial [Saprospiraceae bacterium]|nr:thiamine-phosphate kinase [Saprospiraceae bacterium]
EGIHFDLSYFPVKHLGYKAVVVNVSDIAAMNAIPAHFTVNLAVSNRFSLEAIDEFYAGVRAACDEYNIDLIGGDTSSSAAGLFISVTAVGYVEEDKLTLRSGASDKEIICVTGDLGGAYMGLQVLAREKQVYMANPDMQPRLDKYEYMVGRQLKPEARMDIVHELRDLGVVPTAMIDVSDGLASELLHLSKHNKMALRIYEENLPIDNQTYEAAVEFNLDPITCVLNGGEDYELLFTVRQADYDKLKKHADIHFIGHMEKGDDRPGLVTKNNTLIPLQAQGWTHFKVD